MTDIHDPDVRALLDTPTYAVISTKNEDGTILSTVVWADTANGDVRVNSAVGRRWPTNLKRDPNITVLWMAPDNPYHFVQIQGRAEGTTDGADEHIDALAKKYLGKDEYPYRQPGEQRITFTIRPDTVRLVKQ